MIVDVWAQPYEALLLFHGGAVAGLCYLLLRICRNRREHRFMTHCMDALFVILLIVILAGYLYLANYGVVRGYLLFAFTAGFAAVYVLFAPLFARLTQKIRKK